MASETPTSWVSAVLETVISVWQALIVPAGVGVFAFYKFRSAQQDGKKQVQETREERIQRELDERAEAISKRDADAFDRLHAECDRCLKRMVELENERNEAYQSADAAWDIARAWKDRGYHLKHELSNAQTVANAAYVQQGQLPRQWPDERLPPLDQIIEDNARRFSDRRSIYAPPDDADTL